MNAFHKAHRGSASGTGKDPVDTNFRSYDMMEQVEWYWPVGYAAEVLGISWLEINALVRAGALECIRMPQSKSLKVSQSSVQKYLSARNN